MDGVRTGRWSSGVNPLLSREDIRAFMESGMYGGPPVHRTHPDAIVVNTTPMEYECPACKARGTDLANPCTSTAALPA